MPVFRESGHSLLLKNLTNLSFCLVPLIESGGVFQREDEIKGFEDGLDREKDFGRLERPGNV